MNYLAHIFLSGSNKKMQFGNFIADTVKGSSYNKYPPAIRDGILLHRAIDSFTDTHPSVKEYIRVMRPHFGRYSGILLDIYFDYILASRFEEYSAVSLKRFTKRFYFTMIWYFRWLPVSIKSFMLHFIMTNRLSKYGTVEGIKNSLEIMVKADKLKISAEEAAEYLIRHEQEIQTVFRLLFNELKVLCEGYILTNDRPGYLKEMRNNLSSYS